MFELLGGGNGARHYCKHLPVEHMTLVEKKTELHNAFKIADLACAVNMHNVDIYKFFKTIFVTDPDYKKEFFNVVNLDFCSWFYDNDKPNCTAQIINKMFETQALADNGLLFCTFQVDGFNLDRYKTNTSKDVPLTANEILLQITYLAMNNGYHIKGNNIIFENKYRSTAICRGQTMLNLGFQVVKV